MLSPDFVSYLAGVAVPAGARVKLLGDGTNTVILAGASDIEIGTAILFSGKGPTYAVGDMVGVKLNNSPGSRTLLASGTINHSQQLFRAANGAVSAANAGEFYGVALDSASDGDNVEGLLAVGGHPASANKKYAVTGANSSAGPVDIATAGVLATDRVTEVYNATDNAFLPTADFVPTANAVTQAQAEGDKSAKKLVIRLTGVPV